MEIRDHKLEKLVDEYDFFFIGGLVIPATIDAVAGDKIVFTPDYITIHLSEKPSMAEGGDKLPAETTVIERKQLMMHQHRTRKVKELTSEERFKLQEALFAPSGRVQ